MDGFKVWISLWEHLSVQASYGTAIALHRKISERQNSTYMAFFKPQIPKPPYISFLKTIGLLHF